MCENATFFDCNMYLTTTKFDHIRLISAITAALVAVLAVLAFILSYNSLQHLAAANGVAGGLSYLWPLLLDFGASKVMDKKERFTSFQTLTPGFAPPEQHHKQQLGTGSDIYALGATIYACITGRPPPTSLKREEKNRELKLRGAEKRITQSVIDAIRWALEMDIAKRPQNLHDFADLFLKDTEWPS